MHKRVIINYDISECLVPTIGIYYDAITVYMSDGKEKNIII